MVDTVLGGFEVAVEHGAVALQPNLVRDARRFQPFVAVDLVIANDASDALRENLRSAAWQRIDASCFEPLQRLADGDLSALGKIGDLDHGEGLQMDLRVALLQTADHLAEPI